MDYLTTDDTIAAIASASGSAARGVIRMSGPDVAPILTRAFLPDDTTIDLGSLTKPTRLAGAIDLTSANSSNSQLPGTMLFWPTDRSYTRQSSAEFHTFGSPALLSLALAQLASAGARMALPGEFTLRAFLSGRMDLTQAEAVLAVIDSDSRQKLDTALEQLSGGLAGPLAETRRQLISVLAELEAGLDFVEEDIEFISNDQIVNQLRLALTQVQTVTGQINSRGNTQSAFKVSLAGLPNAGKSSLMNALAGEQKSIVTNIPGTTTDRVAAQLQIEGIEVELSDTAGIEEVEFDASSLENSAANIMATALQLQAQSMASADLVLLCIAPEEPSSLERQLLDQKVAWLKQNKQAVLVVTTKSDLHESISEGEASVKGCDLISTHRPIPVSSTTGAGLDRLKFEIANLATEQSTGESSVVGSTLLRTRESLTRAEAAITDALHAGENQIGEEIIAAEIRQALDELGQIVGTVYTDDILDLVFGRFCIGK
jgi:tRNA modification GTPase